MSEAEVNRQADDAMSITSATTSTSSVSFTTNDDVQIVKPSAKKNFDKHQPVGMFTMLGRGIRGLWRTTETEGVKKSENRDLFVRMTLKELMLYVVYLVTLCLMGFLMLDPMMFQFTRVMKGLFVDDPGFADINTVPAVWSYLQTNLVDGLFKEKYYDGSDVHHSEIGYIFFENKLMGRARLRQLRIQDDSCVVDHNMKKLMNNCYAHFEEDLEEKNPFGILNETAYNNSAWRFSSKDTLQGRVFPGRLATYPGGGYWRELSDNKRESKRMVQDLAEKNWIDRGTRALFVEFSVYNANLNLFSIVTLLFEFPNTGAVTTIYRFSTLKLLRYVTTSDYFVMGLEGVFFLLCLYYTIEEMIEIKKNGLRYFKGVWNCVDIILLVLSYGCLSINLYRTFEVNSTLTSILRTRDEFANFGLVARWQEYFNDLIAVTLFLAWMKVFKYISFNQTMAELENTLITCAKDVMGFCFSFMIIFFAYAQWGFAIFGSQVQSFKTVGDSMLTLFRMILGDFDFMEIYTAKPNWGPFYFISYIFMVFFFLLNMFLAIINDTYAEVKEEMDEEPFDVGAYFKEGMSKAMSKLTSKRDQIVDLKDVLRNADTNNDNQIDFEEWRTHLKKMGHADFEIEALFSKFDVDGDRILNEEEVGRMKEELEEDEEEVEEDLMEMVKVEKNTKRMLSKLMLRDEHDDGESSESEAESDEDGEEKYISSDEFKTLLKRVDQSEENVIEVCTKIENILIKLESMDKSKIKRRETMSRLIDSIIGFMDNPNGGSRRFRSEASLYRPKSQAVASSKVSLKASSLSIKVE